MTYDPKTEEDEKILQLVSIMRQQLAIQTNKMEITIEFKVDLTEMRQTLENDYSLFLSEDAIKRALILDMKQKQGLQLNRILESLQLLCDDELLNSIDIECNTLTFVASKFTIKASTKEISY